MDKKLIIKNFTFTSIFNLGGPLLFLFFILYCAIAVGLGDGILTKILVFLYLFGAIMAIGLANYFSEVVTVDKNGVQKNSLFFSHFIAWSNIKSLDIILVTGDRFVNKLDKKEYFDEFYIGTKEIIISDVEKPMNELIWIRKKKTIRLPFNKTIIGILHDNNQLLHLGN